MEEINLPHWNAHDRQECDGPTTIVEICTNHCKHYESNSPSIITNDYHMVLEFHCHQFQYTVCIKTKF